MKPTTTTTRYSSCVIKAIGDKNVTLLLPDGRIAEVTIENFEEVSGVRLARPN